VFADTARRKQDTSARTAWIARPSKLDQELDPKRNAGHAKRVGTLMQIAGRGILRKCLSGSRTWPRRAKLLETVWRLYSITYENAADIKLMNGGMINFDNMIPTSFGAIFAC